MIGIFVARFCVKNVGKVCFLTTGVSFIDHLAPEDLQAIVARVSSTVEWKTLAVENFGESTNKTVGRKYFGELTQNTKNGEINRIVK